MILSWRARLAAREVLAWIAFASSSFDVSGPFTEFVLTGVLASRTGPGKVIEWDVAKLACTNLPDVNRLVKRTYRKGWEV